MATRLYPPITEEVLSAFYLDYDENGNKTGATININFKLNKAVSMTEIGGIVLRLRTISTNTYIITENSNPNLDISIENRIDAKTEGYAITKDLLNGVCSFQITNIYNSDAIKALNVGQYYKVQIAFVDLNNVIGYWSDVATIKCVAKPNVSIANYTYSDVNIFTNEIVGLYQQNTNTGDSSEKVYSYQFQLFNKDKEVIDDTGVCLHNSSQDTSSSESTDIFKCFKSLDDDVIYYIQYSVTTINGLKAYSPLYQVIAGDSLDLEDNLTLVVLNGLEDKYWDYSWYNNNLSWAPWEEGVIKIYPQFAGNTEDYLDDRGAGKTVTGNYVILRSSSKDNFQNWQEIRRFRLNGIQPSQKIIYDYTVEHGVAYRYALQQYNRAGFYSKKVYGYLLNEYNEVQYDINHNPIYKDTIAEFEDMFLYDGERQLKIRFNPKVNSFKNDLQEQKIDTIGSKYPFIFRNGNICYKEFPISGLISFQEDNAFFYVNEGTETKPRGLFIEPEDYEQMQLSRFESKGRITTSSNAKDALAYSKTDLTSENIMTERYFKLSVLDWLTDGKPKLFKSPTEGNYIVRLMNVSLTPKTELGRMIHEFNCTAYEVADFDYTSLLELGLLTVQDLIGEDYQWYSKNIKDLFSGVVSTNGFYQIDLQEKSVISVSCSGFTPGDQIKLVLENNSTPLIINIGQTGSYIYKGEANIVNLSIKPIKKNTDDVSDRTLLLATKNYTYQKFDMVSSIGLYTQRGEQLVGPIENFFAPTAVRRLSSTTAGKYYSNNPGHNLRNFWEANCVYLEDTFKIDSSITRNTFVPDYYYYWDNNLGKFVLAHEFTTARSYYERLFNGPKILPSELIHLHMKKRTVIPIFMEIDEAQNYSLENMPLDGSATKFFMLTSFGNGFINYVSIAKTNQIVSGTTRYFPKVMSSESTRTKSKNIGELVEFAISACDADRFCLFEVYVPDGHGNWYPYHEKFSTASSGLAKDFIGIYDPLLAERNQKQIEKEIRNGVPVANRTQPGGWWKVSQGYTTYDPTFIYNGELVSLEDKDEITMINLEAPKQLSLGTGVIGEVIYRITYTDYLIENEDSVLRTYKNNFLTLKKEAQLNIGTYQSQVLGQTSGEVLVQKYTSLLQQALEYSNYLDVIITLTNKARAEQVDKINQYLADEKKLVLSYLSQMKAIDYQISLDYPDYYSENESYRLYPDDGALATAKINYLNSINPSLDNAIKGENIYQISTFKNYTSKTRARTNALANIQKVYKHMDTSNYNFIELFYSFARQFSSIILQEIQEELDILGTDRYAAQFLTALDERAATIFNKKSQITGLSNKRIYNLISKRNRNCTYPISEQNTWNSYFHYLYDENNRILPTINYTKETNTNGSISYVLSNEYSQYKNNTFGINTNCYIYDESMYTYKNTSYSLVNVIQAICNQINTQVSGGDSASNKTKYDQLYGGVAPAITINQIPGYYKLAPITVNSSGEGTIDTSSLQGQLIYLKSFLDEYELESIWESISTSFWINNLPENGTKKMQTMVKNMIRVYLNTPEIQDLFNLATACANYLNEHKDELTQEQRTVIYHQIGDYGQQIETLKGGNNPASGTINYYYNELAQAIRDQRNLYNSIDSSNVDTDVELLDEYVDLFNQIVNEKNDAIREFRLIKDRYKYINENYSPSDNIKADLDAEEEYWSNIVNNLTRLSDEFNQNLIILRNKVEFEAYLDFLELYIEYKNIDTSDYKSQVEEYQQLLEQALALQATTINKELSPEVQYEKVLQAWKKLLEQLAKTYSSEIKEKVY